MSKNKKNILPITYENYISNSIELSKYKIPELKQACRENKLHVTGKKSILTDRLTKLYDETKSSILIQKYLRKLFVLRWFKLKGSAFKNRKLCNNTSDFITMECIHEIPIHNFISIMDSNKFIYGYDITSLMTSIVMHNKIKNPYTRDRFSKRCIENIKRLFQLTCILFPDFKQENSKLIVKKREHTNRHLLQRHTRNYIRLNADNYEYRPRYNPNAFRDEREDLIPIWNRITNIRRTTIQERIENLFMEIDLLGNYTQSSWFSQLTYNQYVRFYRYLQDIWNFRSNMSIETKINLCPFYNPFDGVFPAGAEINQEVIKIGCLIVFENFVYCGINEDFRRIGTFHALSALTLVSEPARQSLPWLYESVSFST
tara:strand:- start:242 stop:1357 length:1116 start_codon:yes stop_codon:yes gene_type:complete